MGWIIKSSSKIEFCISSLAIEIVTGYSPGERSLSTSIKYVAVTCSEERIFPKNTSSEFPHDGENPSGRFSFVFTSYIVVPVFNSSTSSWVATSPEYPGGSATDTEPIFSGDVVTLTRKSTN